jgi:hypothetical protein
MKLALTEEQLDKLFEYFDKKEEEPEKFSERHYDEYVRLFHRLKEFRDLGFIKDEEYQPLVRPMFEILARMKEELPFLYGSTFSTER